MNNMSKLALALAGLAGFALAAEPALAIPEANGAGSSAGRNFVGKAPAFLCDASPTPKYYHSNESVPNLHEWQCNVGGTDSRIRYAASASANGYLKLPNGANTTENFLNLASSGCPATGTSVPNFQGSGKTVLEFVCTTPTTTPMNVSFGGADVKAPSLHQKIFNVPIAPPADGHLTTSPTVIVPFAIVVGANVRDGNGALLKTLTDWEIRQILAGNVANWTDLGYSVSAGSAAIVKCHRSVGSGTLATLDETIMKPKFWGGTFPQTANATTINAGSSSGMASCINTNLNSIGYIDSDSVTAATFPSGSYQIAVSGHQINLGPGNGIGTGKARLTDLRCGRYPYWADWNFVTRAGGAGLSNAESAPYNFGSGTDSLIEQLQASMVAHNPLPDYWLSEDDTFVLKNDDRGPHVWFSPSNNGDTIAATCKSGASTQ